MYSVPQISTKTNSVSDAESGSTDSPEFQIESTVEKHISVKDKCKSVPCSTQAKQSVEGRRKRCGTCVGCIATDCGKCRFCCDKQKFGGKGVQKQCCLSRRCKSLRAEKDDNEDLQVMKSRRGLRSKATPSQIVVSCINHCKVYRQDLDTLTDKKWLYDKIIDSYVFLIMEEVNRKEPKSVYSVSCYFYQLLCHGYDKVANWIKLDIFTYKKMIIPVNTGSHWCLVVADFVEQELRYYNSLMGENICCLKKILEFLMKRKPSMDFSKWKMLFPKDIPTQRNAYDCGVLMCMYARCQALDMAFAFNQDAIPEIREKMKIEIETIKLV